MKLQKAIQKELLEKVKKHGKEKVKVKALVTNIDGEDVIVYLQGCPPTGCTPQCPPLPEEECA
jgi:ligand-binding sensor protein